MRPTHTTKLTTDLQRNNDFSVYLRWGINPRVWRSARKSPILDVLRNSRKNPLFRRSFPVVSKTACREFDSYCPCQNKTPQNLLSKALRRFCFSGNFILSAYLQRTYNEHTTKNVTIYSLHILFLQDHTTKKTSTQDETGRACINIECLKQSHISSIERGRSAMSIELFSGICIALKVTPDYLLLGAMHSNNVPKNAFDTLRLCSEIFLQTPSNLR